MDMTSCVARRTRSKTESYLNSLLNRGKAKSVEAQPEVSLASRKDNKRSTSPPPGNSKRRRIEETEDDDDDVEFIGSTKPEGNREHESVEECENAGTDLVISPRLESKSIDSDRVCDFSVDVANLRGEEKKISDSDDDDDDVVVIETIPREEEHVEDYNVDTDLNGEEKKSPILNPLDLVDSESSDEEMSPATSDDDVSIEEVGDEDRDSDDDGDSEDDEDVDNESDYVEESSDSTYIESSESEFDCSDDDEVGARDAAKARKSPNGQLYRHERRKTLPRENNSDVFELLAKSIWERTKIFEEDNCSEDEIPEVVLREDDLVRESSSEKVYKERKPRNRRRVKEKNKSNVFDLLGDSFCGKGESFDGGEAEDSPPINLRFGCEEPEPVEKTEEEKEIDGLWEDMALALKLEGLHSSTPAKVRLPILLFPSSFFFSIVKALY